MSKAEFLLDMNAGPDPDPLQLDDTSLVMHRMLFIAELRKVIELCTNLTEISYGAAVPRDIDMLFGAPISRSLRRLTINDPSPYDIQHLGNFSNIQSIRLLKLFDEHIPSLPQMAASLPRTLRSLYISVSYSAFGFYKPLVVLLTKCSAS